MDWKERGDARMRRFALWLALCLLLAPAVQADETADALDAAFRRYQTLGACVAVFENGEVTYTHCYGVERPGGDEITPDTVFQVGSISKMIAGIGLMQLVEEQGLSLDADIGDLLGFPVRHPEYANTPVTLRQVMTHTASLRDSGDYQLALNGSPKMLSELFSRRASYAFQAGAEPGTRRVYSNFGGGLAGSLIEALSGMNLDAYMRERVFEPLGITAAYQCALLPEDVPVAAMYHMPQRRLGKDPRSETVADEACNPQRHYGLTAGKLLISAPDLCKLAILLCDGGVCESARILKESTVAEMLARQDYRGSVACESGNGLYVNIITDDVTEGRTLYGHGGKAYGMLCAAYFDPESRTGVAMLTNGCNNVSVHNNVGMLSRQIITLCYRELIDPGHTVEDPFAVE